MSSPFVPLNPLESAMVEAQTGTTDIRKVITALIESELAVPSGAEVMQDGSGFQPLLFPKEDVQMVACFTDRSRIGEFASVAPYCLQLNGGDFLRRMPAGYGLVVNPGQSVGFDISPDGIERIVSEFQA